MDPTEDADRWFLDEGEADSALTMTAGGSYQLVLDPADADLLSQGLRTLLMGLQDEVQLFVNQQPDGSCRLLTVQLCAGPVSAARPDGEAS